jgi:predicted Fe-Mo cluster-binding NifX family protein
MKIIITSDGEWMTSKFCPYFEECKYLILYDIKTKEYSSMKSPSYQTKDKTKLINFLKAIFMKHIITGKNIDDKYFKVYIPQEKESTVEEVIIEYLKNINKYK